MCPASIFAPSSACRAGSVREKFRISGSELGLDGET